MIDRAELYARWLSAALMIGTRAAGKTQALQPSVGGSKAPPAPNADDWIERQELQGGIGHWLASMQPITARVDEQMHEAITRATGQELDRLIGKLERAEWLLKVKWENGGHRNLRATEADAHGREQHERSIIMGYRGVHTKQAALELKTTEGAVRWVRRKHGLSIKGERIYPCTVALLNSCAACSGLNEYHDELQDQDAA